MIIIDSSKGDNVIHFVYKKKEQADGEDLEPAIIKELQVEGFESETYGLVTAAANGDLKKVKWLLPLQDKNM